MCPVILLLPMLSTFKVNPSLNSGIVPEIMFLETSITSRKPVVRSFRTAERGPKSWFELRSIVDIPLGKTMLETSNLSKLLDNFRYCKLDNLVKKVEIPSVRWLLEKSMEVIEVGVAKVGRVPRRSQPAK